MVPQTSESRELGRVSPELGVAVSALQFPLATATATPSAMEALLSALEALLLVELALYFPAPPEYQLQDQQGAHGLGNLLWPRACQLLGLPCAIL